VTVCYGIALARLGVIHRVKRRHSNLCDHGTISMLWGKTAYCLKSSGEGVSRYWNKIEAVGVRKCPYYHYLTKKEM